MTQISLHMDLGPQRSLEELAGEIAQARSMLDLLELQLVSPGLRAKPDVGNARSSGDGTPRSGSTVEHRIDALLRRLGPSANTKKLIYGAAVASDGQNEFTLDDIARASGENIDSMRAWQRSLGRSLKAFEAISPLWESRWDAIMGAMYYRMSTETRNAILSRALQKEYWTELIQNVRGHGSSLRADGEPKDQHWQSFHGPGNVRWTAGCQDRDEIHASAILSGRDAKAIFDNLYRDHETIERELRLRLDGCTCKLKWDRDPHRISAEYLATQSWITFIHPCLWTDREDWPRQHDWLREHLEALAVVIGLRL